MKKNLAEKIKKIKLPISIQISIFLVIVAFIPVIVMMALKTYEKQQLELFETLNVQQGRIVASALSSFGVSEENATLILENMKGQNVSRIRILDNQGKLIADSAKFSAEVKSAGNDNLQSENSVNENVKDKQDPQQSFIYKVFSLPVRVYRKILRRPSLYDTADFYSGKTIYDGSEIQTALRGNYGAETRVGKGERSGVILYSAIPVKDQENNVCGVVLVSRSTYKILRNLYELRKDLALVFLKSLIAVIVIAIFFAFRISVPLKKLSRQTRECSDKKGRIFFTRFTGHKRHDEIGELSRSFSSLIEKLNKRIQFTQAFSSDISHEFKNPLTAIRASAELLSDGDLSESERCELGGAIVEEVNHLQLLLTGVRNISKIDAGEEIAAEPVAVLPYLQSVISRVEKKYSGCAIKIESSLADTDSIKIPVDYFDRLSENLIDNGASFGTQVIVKPAIAGNSFTLSVEDNGPGIKPEVYDKIFSRFYSDRSEGQKQNHTGLGLSTVKAITDSLEGEITIGQSESLGGAKFLVKISSEK